MKKKQVNKITFVTSTYIFRSLCLSGLVWQITQISINFFQFDIIKDINVVMPEDSVEVKKVLYICFENSELLSYGRYIDMLESKGKTSGMFKRLSEQKDFISGKLLILQKLTIAERFSISNNITTILDDSVMGFFDDTVQFILGSKMCYQTQILTDGPEILKTFLTNVSSIGVSKSHRLPLFDNRRLLSLSYFGSQNTSIEISLTSYTFSLQRSASPYVEHCIDYNQTRYRSRLGAIVTCENQKVLTKNQLSDLKIIRRSERNSNYTINYISKKESRKCPDVHKNLDCHQIVYITSASSPKTIFGETGTLKLNLVEDTEPSFVIKSKPRIDNIDYVTYIFGAFGAWLGFSFISLNPVPYLLEIKKGKTKTSNPHSNQMEIKRIKSLLYMQRTRYQANQKHLLSVIHDVIEDNRRMDSILSSVVRDVSNMKKFVK